MFKDDSGAAEFEDDVKLPEQVMRKIRAAKELRETIERQETEMITAQVAAMLLLRRKLKLGHRDAGMLLGLSHLRVQQLEHRRIARPPWVHRPVITEADTPGRHLLDAQRSIDIGADGDRFRLRPRLGADAEGGKNGG